MGIYVIPNDGREMTWLRVVVDCCPIALYSVSIVAVLPVQAIHSTDSLRTTKESVTRAASIVAFGLEYIVVVGLLVLIPALLLADTLILYNLLGRTGREKLYEQSQELALDMDCVGG
jgi:hypothetical protein